MKNGKQPVHPTKANVPYEGLTKREYFAAMAMQGLVSTLTDVYTESIQSLLITFDEASPIGNSLAKSIARESIKQADALLKALEE